MAFSMPQTAMRISMVALGLTASAYALDEYLPLAPRVMEIDLGFERGSVLGYFDRSWEMQDQEIENNPMTIPLQGKFGLSEGLEGSMAINFIAKDVNDESGFDRPVLALKYAHPVYHVGGYLAIAPPIGFESVMNSGNYASMFFGALYGKEWKHFRLLTNATYVFNTENEDESKEDQLRVFAKPEYPLPLAALAKKKQYLGVYLGLNYDFYFNAVFEAESLGATRQLFSIMPGINYTFNRIVSSELTATFPLSGNSSTNINFTTPNTQSVRLQVYFTLEETLYNALGG